MARRYLQLMPGEWTALPWSMQQTFIEGYYIEGLLERPEEGPLDADMSVPDDIRSLTASGSGYRAVETAGIDLDAMIGEMEAQR